MAKPMIHAPAHKHLFYAELAKLLEAGFGIREAADVMLDTRLPAPQAALLRQVKTELAAGRSIARAFAHDAGVSPLEESIISAGERGGRMAPAFDHLADYFGMVAAARRKIITGMIYPVILLHLGVVIGIVPNAIMRGQPSSSILTQLAITLLVIYAASAVIALAIRAILKAAPENAAIDTLLNQLPFLGKARRSMALARFTKVYHICVLAGISIRETILTAVSAAHSGSIRRDGKALEQAAVAGAAIGPAFALGSSFPKAFARSYTTAEESGSLDKDLARWTAHFKTEAEQAAAALAVVLPKLLYFLILLFVAWKIIGFYSGYYETLDSIE